VGQKQATTDLPPPPAKKAMQPSSPLRLRAPAIQLNTDLTAVGLSRDGSIEVPHYTKAGWYRLSPTPGEIGPSVIVGHLDNIHGAAVFERLRELSRGQIIEVDRQDGKTAKFVIERVSQYPQQQFPTAEVYGDLNYPGLRIITCGGKFNHRTQRYSNNTIIYASIVPEKSPTLSFVKSPSTESAIGYIL
jgi:hypothetical protein